MLVSSSFACGFKLWLTCICLFFFFFFALGLLVLKEENQDLNEIEQTDHYENLKKSQTKTTSHTKKSSENHQI